MATVREKARAVDASVSAYGPDTTGRVSQAQRLVEQGCALLARGALRDADEAFKKAVRRAPAAVPRVAESYDAAGLAAADRRAALWCHGRAKHYYKRLCRPGSPALCLPEPLIGRLRQALASQYVKLSELKNYDEHATLRAVDQFSKALDVSALPDRPSVYRGRLAAATAWVGHRRRAGFRPRRARLCRMRATAWEDAAMLLRIPAWSSASTGSWETVGALAAACPDKASHDTLKRRILPLLEDALRRDPQSARYGDPRVAAAMLIGHHPTLTPRILAAARHAVAADLVTARELPTLLRVYDNALARRPAVAIEAAYDLPVLQKRFFDASHALGHLVFTAGRFLETAEALGQHAAGEQALAAVSDVARSVPALPTAKVAVTMLSYVCRKMPGLAPASVAHLTALVHPGAGRLPGPHIDAANPLPPVPPETSSLALAALTACRDKPFLKPARKAARAALAGLAMLAAELGHA